MINVFEGPSYLSLILFLHKPHEKYKQLRPELLNREQNEARSRQNKSPMMITTHVDGPVPNLVFSRINDSFVCVLFQSQSAMSRIKKKRRRGLHYNIIGRSGRPCS
jgi:hypothetical protein